MTSMEEKMPRVNNGVVDSSSNHVEEYQRLNIEFPDDIDYYNSVSNEWIEAMEGYESRKSLMRERKIEKVSPLLLRGDKIRMRQYYEPAVVALGPYHHKATELRKTEGYKLITLRLYVSGCGKSINEIYKEVLELTDIARNCYVDGSTDEYGDREFTEMLLLDGCFVLYFIQCLAHRDRNMMLNNEYLGPLGFANVIRDILLLENQLPYRLLELLLGLKFKDKGEAILNTFFNYLNCGELFLTKKKVIPGKHEKQPLHLLEIYRASFLSMSSFGSGSGSASGSERSSGSGYGSDRGSRSASESGSHPSYRRRSFLNLRWGELKKEFDENDEFNYMKRSRSFPSVRELNAKGICFSPTSHKSSADIKFNSYSLYGQLELVPRFISQNSKAIFLNLIAYEVCPHNPNDLRVTTYIRFMKSLLIHPDDVKELRTKQILLHSLGRDEEVAKMYEEIDTPAVNSFMFNKLKQRIERHCDNMYKTWAAELISLYFSSPWRIVALCVTVILLILSFLQTFYTISAPPDKSLDAIVDLLKNGTHIKN